MLCNIQMVLLTENKLKHYEKNYLLKDFQVQNFSSSKYFLVKIKFS